MAGPAKPRSNNNNVVDESIGILQASATQELLFVVRRTYNALSNNTLPTPLDLDTIISLQVFVAWE